MAARPHTAGARPHTAGAKPRRPSADAPPQAAAAAHSVETMRRRVRQLESNQKDWQEEVQKELRRQKNEIDSLKRDNEPLKTQVDGLRAAEATSSTQGGGRQSGKGLKKSKELDAKRETLAHLEARIAHEQHRVDEIEKQVDKSRGTIRVKREKMGGTNIVQESTDMINRQIQVLENRLDQSLVKFNEALRQNKELRDNIDTLRAERDVFDAIYLKLEAELQEKKKEMAFIIEVSNIAYEERDNNVQVLANLKTFAAEEMGSFTEAFKELDDLLEEDRRMKEQVKARLAALDKRDKTLFDEEESAHSKRNKKKNASATSTSPTQLAAADKDTSSSQQVQEYEEAFARIRQATDIPDLDDIVERFLHSEEDNFSLFSYVNDLGKEIEALEKQRSELLDEIDSVTVGNEADQERRAQLKELEDQLRAEEQRNQRFVDMAGKTESILRSVMTSVDNVFTRLDCDDGAIVEQHGITGLTLETLLLYLAAIETKADEYLAAWSRQNNMALETAQARGPQAPHDSMQVSVDPKRLPATGEDGDGSDDDLRPLTREELIAKANKRLAGQQNYGNDRRPVRSKHRANFGASKK